MLGEQLVVGVAQFLEELCRPLEVGEYERVRTGFHPDEQNVNKRDTKVELLFDVAGSPSLGPRQRERILRKLASRIDADGVLHLVVSEERTQGRNREIATERFCELVRGRAEARSAEAPSDAAVESVGRPSHRGEAQARRSQAPARRPDDD